jgi:hypothetical protein
MGLVPRLTAHHANRLTLVIEAAILLAIVGFFGSIWLRERRRRVDHSRPVPEMRD